MLVGGWILFSLMSEPNFDLEEGLVSRAPSSVAPGSQGVQVGLRSGDSVRASGDVMETIALGCLRDGAKMDFKTASRHVRIRGKICSGMGAHVDKSSIINRANGFEATLFKMPEGEFSSDYIVLSDGANQILVRMQDASGKRTVADLSVDLLKKNSSPDSSAQHR